MAHRPSLAFVVCFVAVNPVRCAHCSHPRTTFKAGPKMGKTEIDRPLKSRQIGTSVSASNRL